MTVDVRNRWSNAIVKPVHSNWWHRNPVRVTYWNNWGNRVRHHWSYYNRYHRWFGNNWWQWHPHALCGWHYYYRLPYYPASYWWGAPAWPTLTTWFVWGSTPSVVWQQPVFYDYGPGGNVLYQGDAVYVGGQPVGTPEHYALSAAQLATVPPPADEAQAAAAEWMPLGTFTVATSEDDVDPSRVMQLAVSKEGIVSGTFFNPETDEAQAIQGQVDQETQRVAMRIGDNEALVIETGLYNLTLDEVPLLVHFGTERTEHWLAVRLRQDEETPGVTTSPAPITPRAEPPLP